MTNVGQLIVDKETVEEKKHREWLAQVKPGELVSMHIEIPSAFLNLTRLAIPVMVLVNPYNEDCFQAPNFEPDKLKETGNAITLLIRKQVVILIGEKPTPVSIRLIGPRE